MTPSLARPRVDGLCCRLAFCLFQRHPPYALLAIRRSAATPTP